MEILQRMYPRCVPDEGSNWVVMRWHRSHRPVRSSQLLPQVAAVQRPAATRRGDENYGLLPEGVKATRTRRVARHLLTANALSSYYAGPVTRNKLILHSFSSLAFSSTGRVAGSTEGLDLRTLGGVLHCGVLYSRASMSALGQPRANRNQNIQNMRVAALTTEPLPSCFTSCCTRRSHPVIAREIR